MKKNDGRIHSDTNTACGVGAMCTNCARSMPPFLCFFGADGVPLNVYGAGGGSNRRLCACMRARACVILSGLPREGPSADRLALPLHLVYPGHRGEVRLLHGQRQDPAACEGIHCAPPHSGGIACSHSREISARGIQDGSSSRACQHSNRAAVDLSRCLVRPRCMRCDIGSSESICRLYISWQRGHIGIRNYM